MRDGDGGDGDGGDGDGGDGDGGDGDGGDGDGGDGDDGGRDDRLKLHCLVQVHCIGNFDGSRNYSEASVEIERNSGMSSEPLLTNSHGSALHHVQSVNQAATTWGNFILPFIQPRLPSWLALSQIR